MVVCEYCGTKQTLPKLDDERRANMYDRANHYRRHNDFDKAAGVYEQILSEDKTDAEAYWSLVLCRYGVEYVEDPETQRRIPTIHRTQSQSIFKDTNYQSAIEYADEYQRTIYESEAKSIDEIQKEILNISKNEEDYDVFICYKETDNLGNRTKDSVLAYDLYEELTEEGFRVFFSRVTLEDKLGTAYEPYIFAALNSARVMVVLGSSAENFDSVWVKNEWNRYLSLIQNGADKTLVPAYIDMDPYDLPESFVYLQAQDMSKLGSMQDMVRGIKKILVDKKEPVQEVVKETVATTVVTDNVSPLLERVWMFLKDGEWQKADEYCERVLDMEPKNAQAYIGKLMASERMSRTSQIPEYGGKFYEIMLGDNRYFKKALLFARGDYRKTLVEYRNENIFQHALKAQRLATDKESYLKAAELFSRVKGYKKADDYKLECEKKAEQTVYDKAEEKIKIGTLKAINEAMKLLETIPDFTGSAELLKKLKEERYNQAQEKIKIGKAETLKEALKLLQTIPDFKDSSSQLENLEKDIKSAERKETRHFFITAIVLIPIIIGIITVCRNIENKQKDVAESIELENEERIAEIESNLQLVHFSRTDVDENGERYDEEWEFLSDNKANYTKNGVTTEYEYEVVISEEGECILKIYNKEITIEYVLKLIDDNRVTGFQLKNSD